MNNFILNVDSYKASHYNQYPKDTEATYFYVESRGGDYDETLFFGLQMFIKRYLEGHVVNDAMLMEAEEFFKAHGEPFPSAHWRYIINEYDGHLPIRIKAVKEGSVIPTHNVLMTVESTDPMCYWLPGWLETQLVRAIWYPTTVATRSLSIKRKIYDALVESSDDPDNEINFKLHDFGGRGASSSESVQIGGAAHLCNFMGSDSVEGIWTANHYYNSPMAAFSIPAMEHSTVTAWGKEGEANAYSNFLDEYARPNALIAAVSDSYDIWNAIDNIWGGSLKQKVIDSGATVVVRLDSGVPAQTVVTAMGKLDEAFGSTVNSKGYRVLNHVRALQGDGVGEKPIEHIIDELLGSGYSMTNLAFGCGGELLQTVNRDTCNFAMKLSAIKRNGVWQGVSKSPIGSAMKKSRAGRLALVKLNGTYRTIQGPSDGDLLETVFENGGLMREQSLEEIRKLAW